MKITEAQMCGVLEYVCMCLNVSTYITGKMSTNKISLEKCPMRKCSMGNCRLGKCHGIGLQYIWQYLLGESIVKFGYTHKVNYRLLCFSKET